MLFSGSVQSACGFASAASGPFYCPGDSKVYIDLAFYDQLKRQFQAPGDFAQAYVLAHEVGHHVQNLIGVLPKFNQARRTMGKNEANAMSVRVELQADCFAGIWANKTARKALLEEGDIDEALNAARQIGDDTIQKRTQGYVVPDAFNHGTSQQRRRWFGRGFETGRLDACDTFSAARVNAAPQGLVGQRAIFEEQGAEGAPGKSVPGVVTWSQKNRENGLPAIVGIIDLPDRNAAVSLMITKNTDNALLASHLIEIEFRGADGLIESPLERVPALYLKQTAQARGKRLAGEAVPVTENLYWIALSDQGDQVSRNLVLLREGTWFGLPLLFKNGRGALITFEKGIPGDQVFEAVLAAWESGDDAPPVTAGGDELADVPKTEDRLLDEVAAPLDSAQATQPVAEALTSETPAGNAGQLEDGLAAYEREDYATALRLPTAISGSVRHPKGYVELRLNPDAEAPGILKVPNRARVTILDNVKPWYRVRYANRIGFMHHTWVMVDQFLGGEFDRKFIQIKSFRGLQEAEAYIRSSPLSVSAFLSTNGWLAVALDGQFSDSEASHRLRQLKTVGTIPDDSFRTYGNSYVKKLCCGPP